MLGGFAFELNLHLPATLRSRRENDFPEPVSKWLYLRKPSRRPAFKYCAVRPHNLEIEWSVRRLIANIGSHPNPRARQETVGIARIWIGAKIQMSAGGNNFVRGNADDLGVQLFRLMPPQRL